MAASVKSPRYGNNATYGSMAYDVGRAERYRERIDRPVDRQIIIPAAPKIREEVATAARVRTNQAVSPLAIVGYICAAILVIFTLMAKVQLTEITDASATLEQQLNELSVAQNRLLIDYEKAFNMTEIEEYATSNLGMQRPRDEQLYYLDSTVPDKAVIINEEATNDGLGDRILDALSSIAEYFR